MSTPSHSSKFPAVLRRSLRTPIVLAVVLANLVTFTVLMIATSYAESENRRTIVSDYTGWLTDQLDEIVDANGRINVAQVLQWRGWRRFDDVLVAQAPSTLDASPLGSSAELFVPGIYLNPLGRAARGPLFDEQNALRMIEDAITSRGTVESTGDADLMGAATPIGLPGQEPWGGVWFRRKDIEIGNFPKAWLSLIFVATMALFTALILWILQRSVLDPVVHIAGVVRILEDQNLRARVNVPDDRFDEIAGLGHGLNAMATRLQSYSDDLEAAVLEATARVKSAESAAMTQRRLAATGELAAGVAHELNNPIGGLSNAVEALGRPDLTPSRRDEYLALVSGGLERMRETVGRLLRLSPRESRTEDVHLARPLADALGLVRHRAEEMNVELIVTGPGELPAQGVYRPNAPRPAFSAGAMEPFHSLPPIRGAANELGQAILNLVVNALDAIEEGRETGASMAGPGRVELTLDYPQGGAVTVVCQDDGPGVAESVMERASDAFFTTKSQGKGNGLGLAIVNNVVAAHGGRVLLSSRPADGFRVTIELPVAIGETPHDPARFA